MSQDRSNKTLFMVTIYCRIFRNTTFILDGGVRADHLPSYLSCQLKSHDRATSLISNQS